MLFTTSGFASIALWQPLVPARLQLIVSMKFLVPCAEQSAS